MTDDQQFILGILGLIGGVATQLLLYRQGAQTHAILNGVTVRKVARGRAAGRRAGLREGRVLGAGDVAPPGAP